jgi:hypothetical protein
MTICLDQFAGPALAHLELVTQKGESFTLGGGPYYFFDRSSFSAALSTMLSASSFSLPFSSSRSLNYFASDTSMLPNLAFQF